MIVTSFHAFRALGSILPTIGAATFLRDMCFAKRVILICLFFLLIFSNLIYNITIWGTMLYARPPYWMKIPPLSYYSRLLCRWRLSLRNVNTPRCPLSSRDQKVCTRRFFFFKESLINGTNRHHGVHVGLQHSAYTDGTWSCGCKCWNYCWLV